MNMEDKLKPQRNISINFFRRKNDCLKDRRKKRKKALGPNLKNIFDIVNVSQIGGRHSTVDLSAPTILRPRV